MLRVVVHGTGIRGHAQLAGGRLIEGLALGTEDYELARCLQRRGRIVEAMRELNHIGYAGPDSELVLDLVYNPAGAYKTIRKPVFLPDRGKRAIADKNSLDLQARLGYNRPSSYRCWC